MAQARLGMSFDRLARHYTWMEWLLAGNQLHRCRTAFLDRTAEARAVLLVGEGHGRYALELCRSNPQAQIVCVDASSEMNCVAQTRLADAGIDCERVRFVSQPLREFSTPLKFDLVATHFFLDCFQGPELGFVVEHLTRFLNPAGLWAISDFQIPARSWPRLRALLVLRLAYMFFRVTTNLPARRLEAPARLIEQHQFKLLQRREFNFDLLYAELWQRR